MEWRKFLPQPCHRFSRMTCRTSTRAILVTVWLSCGRGQAPSLRRSSEIGMPKETKLLRGAISRSLGWLDAIREHEICTRFGRIYAMGEIVSPKFLPNVGIIA